MMNVARSVRKVMTIDCHISQVSVRPKLDCHWTVFNWSWYL